MKKKFCCTDSFRKLVIDDKNYKIRSLLGLLLFTLVKKEPNSKVKNILL